MEERNKIFIISDLHLGAPSREASLPREKHFVQWLQSKRNEASEIIFLGDVFDFWFEYRRVVPRGFTRLFGKLAELSDDGIPIHIFPGNHDLWYTDYLKHEFGAIIHPHPLVREFHGKNYFLAHGDGLGPGDKGYKFVRKIFVNPFSKWMFHRLHPNFGIGLADYFSKRSRNSPNRKDKVDYGEKEFLLIFSREYAKEHPEINYFVFGHRHLPKIQEFETGKYYVNLGDWIKHFSYLEITPDQVRLLHHPMDDDKSGNA